MLKTWLIRLSVLLNALVFAVVVFIWQDPGVFARSFIESLRAQMVEQFEQFPLDTADVVFVGDSITHAAPWEEMFPSLPTRNRGIAGDTTTNVLDRLEQIISGKPRVVFLKIGTNDLTHGPDIRQDSYRQYREIVARIRAGTPATTVYVQSILPRSGKFRDEVEGFNREIRKIASEMTVTYIDLYPAFLAEDGSIMDEFSSDELHLNAVGYAKWQALLEPYMEEYHR